MCAFEKCSPVGAHQSICPPPHLGEALGGRDEREVKARHRERDREGERERGPLPSFPIIRPSRLAKLCRLRSLIRRANTPPSSAPPSSSSATSSSISRYISPPLLSLDPFCRWRLSISRQDCICRLVASPHSILCIKPEGGRSRRKRGTSVSHPLLLRVFVVWSISNARAPSWTRGR